MSGSPRKAHVPAARGLVSTGLMCNMSVPSRPRSVCNTYRSFTICLIIAIIITESPTSGFTIRRTNNIYRRAHDLSAEEKILLEDKHDLKLPNDIKLRSTEQTNIDGAHELSGVENKSNKTTVFLPSVINKQRDVKNRTQYKPITESNETRIAQESITNIVVSRDLNTRGSKETSSKTSNISNEELSRNSTPSSIVSSSKEVSQLNTDESSASPFTEYVNTREGATSTKLQSTTTNMPKFIITGVLNFESKSVTESNNSSKIQNLKPRKDFLEITNIKSNDTKNDHLEVTTRTTSVSPAAAEDSMAKPSVAVDTTMEIDNDITSTKYNNKLFGSVANHTPLKINTSQFQTTTALRTDGTSRAVDTTEQFPETMTIEQTSSLIAEPLTKNYTEIDRKRMAITLTDEKISPTTISDNEMVNADNMRTHISLENIFNATPILSLEKLRHDLSFIPTQTSTVNQNVTEVTQLSEVNLSSTLSTNSFTRTPKREMVSSMRAGFLDLTAKTVEPRVSKAAKNKETNHEEQAFRIGNKTANRFESQSQLAEDAIKEELLKEEMLLDNEENVKRYHEYINVDRIKLLDGKFKEPKISQGNSSDDSLSVKPIGQDKSKLYTVSPNYKPMKKIDVQPSKQFVRDPDDNSWRNESISSLGIVFKPKNSSKSFTQVLKNKTETEFTNLSDRNKNDLPELRERLEKIAEVRKSKKKRIDKFGETIYTDYEENSASGEITTPKTELGPEFFKLFSDAAVLTTSIKPTSPSSLLVVPSTAITNTTEETIEPKLNSEKKFYNIAEYYDTNDEYDADYMHLSKLDLKKFPEPFKTKEQTVTPPAEFPQTKSTYAPDRKATVQYFPPRLPPKVKYDDYDDKFQKKVNVYPYKHRGILFDAGPTFPTRPNKIEQADREYNVKPLQNAHIYKPIDLTKNLYLTSSTRTANPHDGYGNVDDEIYNRPTYVIKHFNQDFISDTKNNDENRTPDFLFTEPPVRGVTINDLEKSVNKIKLPPEDDYEYDTHFRKDIMNRFIDNFNQNSDKYKVDFPILYNNSVVHRKINENGKTLASSSALMKRLYNDVSAAKVNNYFMLGKPCEPHCDNVTVELSPSYELHYYVPDQEEKEEIERQTPSYRYRL